MAETSQKNIQELSPDRLMTRFRRSGILVCVIAAFALHVVLIGGTSVDYIHGMIDPAWAERQEQIRKEQAARRGRAEAKRKAGTATAPAATAPAGKAAKAAATPVESRPAGRRVPKELTDLPEPNDLPPTPRGGISIDETEGR